MGSPCIEWAGRRDRKGYGCAGMRNGALYKSEGAHRVAWRAVHGPIPDGNEIDHLCRNRACVNVDHLELVTHLENVRRGSRATMTKCCKGHPFDGTNTYQKPEGGRQCRACNAAAVRRYRQRSAA